MQLPENIILLENVSKETIEVLSKASVKKNFKSHQTIIKYGDPANGLYIIKSGIVKVSSINEKGTKTLLFLLSDAKAFGANSILPNSIFKIDVKTFSETELCYIPKETLFERMKNDKHFLFNLFNWMCQEIERIEITILNNLKSNVASRFASLLLNNEFKNKNVFSLEQISIQEIADLLGTSKTYLLNTINKLKKQTIVDYDRKSITILNSVKLRQLIETNN